MSKIEAGSLIRRQRARAIGLAGLFVANSLATSAVNAGDDEPRAIFVMQRDGAVVRNVVSLKDFQWLGNPAWSRDGESLAFDAKGSGKPRVFTLGADGKNLLDLGEGAMPCWSPDGKQLAFHVSVGTGPAAETAGSVWIQNVDGKGRVQLVEGLAPRWSPDGDRIALGGTSLRILDTNETKSRDVFASGEKVHPTAGFDWSPDGKRLAAIIERDGGRELVIVSSDASDEQITTRLRGNLHDVAWSPREDLLAVSIQDEKSGQRKLHLLTVEGNDPGKLIAGQEGDNREPSWSPDGKQLAFASSRKSGAAPAVAVGRLRAKLELVRKHDPGGEVYNLAFGPDGRTALLGCGLLNRRIQLWDIANDTARDIEIGAWSVAISPDGRHGACAPSHTKIVHYIDLEDGSVVHELVHGRMVIALQFSHDGSKLATIGEDDAACIFNVDSGDELLRLHHQGQVSSVQWSRDNKLLGVTCVDKKLHLWNAATGQKVREIKHAMVPYSLAFSPDGVHAITGTGGDAVSHVLQLNFTPMEENPIFVWDIASGKLIREMKGHEHAVFGVEYSPDGKYIASASFDYSVRLWDAEQGVELDRVTGEGFATKAVFSPDGSQLLVGGGMRRTFNAQETIFESKYWTPTPNERLRLFKVATSSAANEEK
jgi:WD40 repeat protein